MLYLKGKFLNASELEARGNYPVSYLITVLDEKRAETLNLVGPREVFDLLADLPQLAEVVLELRWRRMDLAALGGSGRGKAYRLSVTSVVEPTP